ncbi:24354_t:CDS:2, partial [Dentiscutata erythropus]
YLIDGEREAEQALKKHWLGEVIDYALRRRAESELVQVQSIIKLLREMAPNLINFETFLKEYRRKIQDVIKEVKSVPKKPSAEDIKYLKKAVSNNVYLKKIRIWSSDMVNAIAFLYSDDTSDIYGTPGDGDSYDFEWRKDEKIQHILIRTGSVLHQDHE